MRGQIDRNTPLGTSLPDTFASRTAATNDETAAVAERFPSRHLTIVADPRAADIVLYLEDGKEKTVVAGIAQVQKCKAPAHAAADFAKAVRPLTFSLRPVT